MSHPQKKNVLVCYYFSLLVEAITHVPLLYKDYVFSLLYYPPPLQTHAGQPHAVEIKNIKKHHFSHMNQDWWAKISFINLKLKLQHTM